METLHLTEWLISLLTLTALEIVLGVDNLIFVAIASSRLAPAQQPRARRIGLLFAWVTRLLFLAFAVWLSGLTQPLLQIGSFALSIRDIFLFAGGTFLIVKATREIHQELEPVAAAAKTRVHAKFWLVVLQIAVLDIVFSLDSVITAIGLTRQFVVMAIAITIAILTMIFLSDPLSRFVMQHPTIKMLALSFLILIGMVLIADGMHYHVPRGYVYFAIIFSVTIEALNLLRNSRQNKNTGHE